MRKKLFLLELVDYDHYDEIDKEDIEERYIIGYAAGGTYANGLVAKSVTKGVNSFFSQSNKVRKLLKITRHNLSKYTPKTAAKLMKKTLAKGTFEAYKTVNSMVLASTNSQVTYVIINGAIMISDMWIRMGG